MPDPILHGRTAVVTGASRGIGLAIARFLAHAGCRVYAIARTETSLRAAAEEAGAIPVVCDVTQESSVERVRDELAVAGAPDIVVNAAGAFALSPLAQTDVATFDKLVDANLRGPFLVIRAFLPEMLQRRHGDVVSIGSVAGRHAFPSNGAYSASKFGLRGLHAVLDQELRGTGVRSLLVEPAATNTPLWDEIDRAANPGLPERASMLDSDAVARAVLHAIAQPQAVATRNIIIERA